MTTVTGTYYQAEMGVHSSVQKAYDAICHVSARWTENTKGETELILEHSGLDELKKRRAVPGNEQRMGRKRKGKNGQFIQHKTEK